MTSSSLMTAAPWVALAPILAAGLVWGQFVPDSTLQSAQTHEIRPIRSAELGRLLFSEHRLRRADQGVVPPVSRGDRRPRCRPSSPPGDYLDRLTAAAELRRDAARAVASAVARGYGLRVVPGVRPVPDAYCARRKGTPAACVGCRCSEALAGALVRLGKAPDDPHAVFTWSP